MPQSALTPEQLEERQRAARERVAEQVARREAAAQIRSEQRAAARMRSRGR